METFYLFVFFAFFSCFVARFYLVRASRKVISNKEDSVIGSCLMCKFFC